MGMANVWLLLAFGYGGEELGRRDGLVRRRWDVHVVLSFLHCCGPERTRGFTPICCGFLLWTVSAMHGRSMHKERAQKPLHTSIVQAHLAVERWVMRTLYGDALQKPVGKPLAPSGMSDSLQVSAPWGMPGVTSRPESSRRGIRFQQTPDFN